MALFAFLRLSLTRCITSLKIDKETIAVQPACITRLKAKVALIRAKCKSEIDGI